MEEFKKRKLSTLLSVSSGKIISVSKLKKVGKYQVWGGNGFNGYTDSYNTSPNNLIIGRVGEKCGNVRLNKEKIWVSDNALIVKEKTNYNKCYMKYLLSHINLNSYANHNAQPVISGKIIDDIEVKYCDNLEEQKAIANVLNNVDKIIESIQRLIDKKEKIKFETMNELISGKIRVPGYSEEFTTTTLHKNGFAFNGLSGLNSSNFGSGNNRYITFLNVLKNPIINCNEFEKVNFTNTQNKVRKGDLFFNTSSETPEEVAMCATIVEDIDNLYLNSFCFGYRLNNDKIDNVFLSYFFRSTTGRNIIKNIAQGSTRFNLPKKQFLNYEITIPNTYEEQKAIGNILVNMDNEIYSLEEKLEKYKRIKEGMMGDLLSGKVRLNSFQTKLMT